MIKRKQDYRIDIRKEMRGGSGEVEIQHLWEPGDELKAGFRLFAKIIIPPGAGIGFHEHQNEEEVFFIIRGEAEADDNGTVVSLNAGDTIHTGGGKGHAIRCKGDEQLELMAVIAKY